MVDDGSCDIPGCTDSESSNFDPSASISDGSCRFRLGACTDPEAANTFAGTATTYDVFDDGSCKYQGCMDSTAMNYNSNANLPGTCVMPVLGCTDTAADNFWAAANSGLGRVSVRRLHRLDAAQL